MNVETTLCASWVRNLGKGDKNPIRKKGCFIHKQSLISLISLSIQRIRITHILGKGNDKENRMFEKVDSQFTIGKKWIFSKTKTRFCHCFLFCKLALL